MQIAVLTNYDRVAKGADRVTAFIAGIIVGIAGFLLTVGHFVLRPWSWRQGYDAAHRGEKRL